MTGGGEDGPDWQKHIGNTAQRRELANQLKDAKHPFKIVIVRDRARSGGMAVSLLGGQQHIAARNGR